MLTVCWAAKGGSGTTVYAVAKALVSAEPTLLIDLAGDVPAVLGLPDPEGPGIAGWLRSNASTDRLAALELAVSPSLALLTSGSGGPGDDPARWLALAEHLRLDPRRVIVDAGTGPPPPALAAAADERLLVTRPCYIALRRAAAVPAAPTGVVLVDEPGRALTPGDVEASVGAPVVDTVLVDPLVARAADAGLLVSRLPRGWRRHLRRAA